MTESAKQAANIIQQKAPGFKPRLGITLGSGLGPLADQIENPVHIPFNELPNFPPGGVEGHGKHLILGTLKGVPVACLQGRAHYYEGISDEVALTYVRTLKLIGCDTLLITNSSGSFRHENPQGSLVLIRDHINMQWRNPLVGPNDEDFGPRFVPLEHAYDEHLRHAIKQAAKKINIPLNEGVYLGLLGPVFETPAEVQMFSQWGADVVGMSTLNEVIAARHCGLRLAVVSVITNMGVGLSEVKVTHDQTLRGAQEAGEKLLKLVSQFLEDYEQTN